MKRRGISLLELLVAIVMTAIVTIGAVNAYSIALSYHLRVLPEREEYFDRVDFERKLSSLLSRAYVDGTDQTYFVIGVPGGGSTGTSNPDSGDSLTLTVRGMPIAGAVQSSTDDFETQHSEFGPQGGIAEVTISTTPYAQVEDQTGLFLREQRPSDGDPLQGGFESNWNPSVATMTFEVWDGIQWTATWDTTLDEEARLPAAIRVTYRLDDDPEDSSRQFIVRFPMSDVTSANPIETGGRP